MKVGDLRNMNYMECLQGYHIITDLTYYKLFIKIMHHKYTLRHYNKKSKEETKREDKMLNKLLSKLLIFHKKKIIYKWENQKTEEVKSYWVLKFPSFDVLLPVKGLQRTDDNQADVSWIKGSLEEFRNVYNEYEEHNLYTIGDLLKVNFAKAENVRGFVTLGNKTKDVIREWYYIKLADIGRVIKAMRRGYLYYVKVQGKLDFEEAVEIPMRIPVYDALGGVENASWGS